MAEEDEAVVVNIDEPTPPKTEAVDNVQAKKLFADILTKRETARQNLAYGLLIIFAVLSISTVWVYLHSAINNFGDMGGGKEHHAQVAESVEWVFTSVVTTVLGIIGTIFGFYFGSVTGNQDS